MKWIKKLFILSLFIPIFMFKNTSAVEYNTLVKPVKTFTVDWSAQYKKKWGDSWSVVNLPTKLQCNHDNLTECKNNIRYVGSIHSRANINITKGHYYEIKIALFTENRTHDPLGIFWSIQNSGSFNLVNIKEEVKQNDTSFEQWEYQGSNFVGSGDTISYNGQYLLYTITLIANNTSSTPLVIGDTNKISMEIMPPTDIFYVAEPTLSPLRTITEYEAVGDEAAEVLKEINDKDEQDRSDIESQSDSTDSEADSAGNAAESTGTSLFSAFTQLLTALTSVNGSSCRLPRMQVYSLDFGRMDLCQFDIPPQIMALVSIGMVFIIVPLGINLVKRMISLYKEITG